MIKIQSKNWYQNQGMGLSLERLNSLSKYKMLLLEIK